MLYLTKDLEYVLLISKKDKLNSSGFPKMVSYKCFQQSTVKFPEGIKN